MMRLKQQTLFQNVKRKNYIILLLSLTTNINDCEIFRQDLSFTYYRKHRWSCSLQVLSDQELMFCRNSKNTKRTSFECLDELNVVFIFRSSYYQIITAKHFTNSLHLSSKFRDSSSFNLSPSLNLSIYLTLSSFLCISLPVQLIS